MVAHLSPSHSSWEMKVPHFLSLLCELQTEATPVRNLGFFWSFTSVLINSTLSHALGECHPLSQSLMQKDVQRPFTCSDNMTVLKKAPKVTGQNLCLPWSYNL